MLRTESGADVFAKIKTMISDMSLALHDRVTSIMFFTTGGFSLDACKALVVYESSSFLY